MAINRYSKDSFPVYVAWDAIGRHTIRFEDRISTLNIGKSNLQLKDIMLGANIKHLSDECCLSCTNLLSVNCVSVEVQDDNNESYIAKTELATIGDRAFKDCINLSALNLNDDTLHGNLGNQAFYNTNLPFLKLSSHDIGDYAFAENEQMTYICLSAHDIGTRAFSHYVENAGLSSAMIKANSIGNHAFSRTGLEELSVDGGSIYQRAFYGCEKLKTLYLSCDSLDAGSFANCPELTSVQICNITSVLITNLEKSTTSLDDLRVNTDPLNQVGNFLPNENFSGEQLFPISSAILSNYINIGPFSRCSKLKKVEFANTLRCISCQMDNTYKIYDHSFNWQTPYPYQQRTQHAYISFQDEYTGVFTNCPQLEEIRFNFIPDDQNENEEVPEDLSVVMYEHVFSHIHFNDTDTLTQVIFDDTYAQAREIIVDKDGNKILDNIIRNAFATNPPGTFGVLFKEDSFNPSAHDTLLTFNNPKDEGASVEIAGIELVPDYRNVSMRVDFLDEEQGWEEYEQDMIDNSLTQELTQE